MHGFKHNILIEPTQTHTTKGIRVYYVYMIIIQKAHNERSGVLKSRQLVSFLIFRQICKNKSFFRHGIKIIIQIIIIITVFYIAPFPVK